MVLAPDAAYLAIRSRDARFDGRLFVGVTSTGIYCRPICRVRTPRRENCRFFETPAQAEAAAFRPCLKCRPEVAPGPGVVWSVMDASRTLARQAADWLDAHAAGGEEPSVAALARQLGVSDRHLRRIFQAEHGVTPMQYLQTRRLLTAKQLLTDTQLPVAQVAYASGFRSLRRFNACFADSYRMSPTRLRRAAPLDDPPANAGTLTLALGLRAPYQSERLARFIAQRAIPGVECVDGLRLRRTVRPGTVADVPGWLEVALPADALRQPFVQLTLPTELAAHSARIVAAVRRWLDLDAAPHSIHGGLADLPGEPGQRLPGGIDAFELMVRAVLGQQVTVAAARTLARRLVERFGTPCTTPWPALDRLFPSPEALAAAEPAGIGELGVIGGRASAIVALARQWPVLAPLLRPGEAPAPLIAALCALPGIGPWTAHYIAMRALSWPDAFPPNDVAVMKAMKQLFGTQTLRDADTRAAAWRPWRAYAVLRLWSSLETTP